MGRVIYANFRTAVHPGTGSHKKTALKTEDVDRYLSDAAQVKMICPFGHHNLRGCRIAT